MKRSTFQIGNKTIGDGNVLIQSMGDRKTTKTDELIPLTNDLSRMGLDMMRFSVLDKEDAKALSEIKKNVSIPIIADIHFDTNLALLAIESGADKIRINPGNVNSEAGLREVIALAKKKNIAMRIGLNSGSLNRYKGKGKDFVDDYFLALDATLAIFREMAFDRIVLSLKTSSPEKTYALYKRAYTDYPYPLHIGLTESGFGVMGSIKSALALQSLLSEHIGDTIRVSLADDRREEVRACKTLLRTLALRKDLPELVVCPTCGRTLIDLKDISREVARRLDYVFKPVKVAVMGCPVNGIGEAKDADFGIAGSGKKDVYLLFSKGHPLGTYEKEEALSRLFGFIDDFR